MSPIPGGVGIAEAGLTAGLVSIGVPVEFAFPAAMLYRLCTFYVPPAYGWAVLGVCAAATTCEGADGAQ